MVSEMTRQFTFVLQCTYVFEIAADIEISKWPVSVVKCHLFPSVSVKYSLWDMVRRLRLWFGTEQYFNQKHGVDMVIQQPQSAKPFSMDKINFNVDYNSAQYKWWSRPRGMLFPLPKNLHQLSHRIFILKRGFKPLDKIEATTPCWNFLYSLSFLIQKLDWFSHYTRAGKKTPEVVLARLLGRLDHPVSYLVNLPVLTPIDKITLRIWCTLRNTTRKSSVILCCEVWPWVRVEICNMA
jgi:hypothetical protein